MTPGDLFWLTAAMTVTNVVMFLVYQSIFSVRKRKTYTMRDMYHDMYRSGTLSPRGSEWSSGQCETCLRNRPVHAGYGQCYSCIHGARD